MTPTKASSLLIITLFLSVLLNVILTGSALGLFGTPHHKPFGIMAIETPHGDYMVSWITRQLEPADADLFRTAYNAEAEELTRARKQMREATNNVSTVFQMKQPNPEVLRTAMDQLDKARNKMHASVSKILESTYEKLSPDGRQRLATLTTQNRF